MARFLGGFLAFVVLVCCIVAGAMGGCTVGMPLTMISNRSSNIGMMMWAVVICLGAATGFYFGIRAAKAVFRSITNTRPLPPPPSAAHEDEEKR